MNKGKPSENSLNIAKNQKFELITSRHFKNLISQKPAWNIQWSLSPSRNLKPEASLPMPNLPIFQIFFKRDFSENAVNLDMGI